MRYTTVQASDITAKGFNLSAKVHFADELRRAELLRKIAAANQTIQTCVRKLRDLDREEKRCD